AAAVDRRPGLARGLLEDRREVGADGLRHPHVGDDAVAEERRDATASRVEELVGDDEVEGADRLPHAADGRDRDHPLGAERLQTQTFAPKFSLVGRTRWPRPWRGRKITRRPANRPTQEASDGPAKGGRTRRP